MQPSLQLCGQLPAAGADWDAFWAADGGGDGDTAAPLAAAAAAADRLLRQLLQLQVGGEVAFLNAANILVIMAAVFSGVSAGPLVSRVLPAVATVRGGWLGYRTAGLPG